ncbi:MAG: helix-turn-helix domain-containing protein, partial [Fibrobacteria bacterium]
MTAGRPTTYRPEYAEQARKLCRNGATDREIADILGVCVRTFYRWRA